MLWKMMCWPNSPPGCGTQGTELPWFFGFYNYRYFLTRKHLATKFYANAATISRALCPSGGLQQGHPRLPISSPRAAGNGVTGVSASFCNFEGARRFGVPWRSESRIIKVKFPRNHGIWKYPLQQNISIYKAPFFWWVPSEIITKSRNNCVQPLPISRTTSKGYCK